MEAYNHLYRFKKAVRQRPVLNASGTVIALISREDFYAGQSEAFVANTFQGSLPAFLAAFGRRKKISDSEFDEIQKIINEMRGE